MRKTILLLLLFSVINCVSITNLKLDENSAKLEKENYFYIQDKFGIGRPYFLRDLMMQVSNEDHKMIEFENEDSLKNKKYFKLYSKNIKKPSSQEQILMLLSAITYSIIPVESTITVQYNIEVISNQKQEKNIRTYEYDLSICMALYSLNCKLFNDKEYTLVFFVVGRLNEEVNKPIANSFVENDKTTKR